MKMGNKILKALLLVSASLLCTMCTVGAEYIESVDVNYTNSDKVEISGRDFVGSNGQYATIFVLRGDDLDAKDFKPGTDDDKKVERRTQVEIKDGKFYYEFQLDMASMPEDSDKAVYTAYIQAGSTEKVNSFAYTKEAKLTSLYNSLKGMSKEEFVSAVYNESARFVTSDSVYNGLDTSDDGKGQKAAIGIAFAEWEKEIKNIANVNEGVERLKTAITKASIVEALNEGKSQYVVTAREFNNPDILGLDKLDGTAYSLFSERDKSKLGINNDGKDKVIENIQNRSYESLEDFQKGFVYEATLAAIHYNNLNIDGNMIITILEENNSYNNFEMDKYDAEEASDIASEIRDNNLWAFDDVQDVLKPETSGGTGGSTGGGTGGSTGGGSSSASSGRPSSSSGSTGSIGGYTGNYAGKITFNDIDSVEWAKSAIESLAEKGIVAGRGNGIFAPLDNVTRAEFITMLVKTFGLTGKGVKCDFADVKEGEWYYDFVAVGANQGIISGYGNGYFGTHDLITRQDAAVMINNTVAKLGRTLEAKNDGIDFADKADISDYAAAAVDTLVKAGVLSGADGNFMPKKSLTRAEAAVMLSNIISALGLGG